VKNKSIFIVKCFAFFFCFFLTAAGNSLFAQNYKQTLRWGKDPNVLEYKVEIQNSQGEIIKSEITEGNSISLSLGQGRYKYKITAYDLLGREAVATEWINFEILVANQPAIVHNNSLEALGEDGKTLELDVNIDDVTSDTKAELVNIASSERIIGKLILEAAAGSPSAGLSASETHKAIKARFSNVPEGKWKLVITNPSGLSSESEIFEVRDIIKEERIAAQKAAEAAEAEKKRLAELEAKKAEEERLAREKEEQLLKELEEAKIREEAERLAAIEAAEREETERLAAIEAAEREEAERLAAIEEAAQREEEERLAREETEAEEKEAEKKRRREAWLNYDRKFYINAGVGLAVPLYDNNFFEDLLEKNYFNPAITAQIGFLPFHTEWFRFGMEINAIATNFRNEKEFFNIDLNTLFLQDNLAFRLRLGSKKHWLQVKGGGGIVLIQEKLDYYGNTENNKSDKTAFFGYYTAGGGLSYIIIPSAMFKIEIGADFYNLFITDKNIGILTPYIGLGIRF